MTSRVDLDVTYVSNMNESSTCLFSVGNSETNKTILEIIVDRLTMQAISQKPIYDDLINVVIVSTLSC